MRLIETVHAEPRESIDSPVYRVNFWAGSTETSWALDAFAVQEAADVAEVIAWANEQAGGRRFEIFVEMHEEREGSFQTPRQAGLIRLLGSNPNAGESVLVATFVTE